MSHPPQLNHKKAEKKMFMCSIVWSYSKDLLHHAALKIHLVVGKFQGKIHFFVLLVNKAIAVMCLAHLRAFIQQISIHKHKQLSLD